MADEFDDEGDIFPPWMFMKLPGFLADLGKE